MKSETIYIFIILACSLFLSFVCGCLYTIENNNMITRPVALQIAHNLYTESDYNIHVWDCSNMSSELEHRLNSQGYNSTYRPVMMLVNGTYQCHTIVSYTAYIESTSGTVINPQDIGTNKTYVFMDGNCKDEYIK